MVNKSTLADRTRILSWALIDAGNSAYATTVIAGFFPIFFKEYWSQGYPTNVSTSALAFAGFVSGGILALTAPFIGAYADRSHSQANFVFFTAIGGALATSALYFLAPGDLYLAALFFMFGNLFFAVQNIFYDSLLVHVATSDEYDRVSALGYSLGYFFGGILFLANALMVTNPQWFGIADSASSVKISFLTVAVWWVVFTIPCYLKLKTVSQNSNPNSDPNSKSDFKSIYNQVLFTGRKLFKEKYIFWFLLAYFFYIEGVNTTIRMAIDYGLSLGFQSKDLIQALLLVQFVAFPFALFFGWIGKRFGALFGIGICVAVYFVTSLFGMSITNVSQFYLMAVAIGSVQGGIQSLSRSHFSKLIPKATSTEYFGFFNVLGKFSSVVGPLLIGMLSLLFTTPLVTLYVVLGLFTAGGALLVVHKKSLNRVMKKSHLRR
jgi:UMF1 family MFS transporter